MWRNASTFIIQHASAVTSKRATGNGKPDNSVRQCVNCQLEWHAMSNKLQKMSRATWLTTGTINHVYRAFWSVDEVWRFRELINKMERAEPCFEWKFRPNLGLTGCEVSLVSRQYYMSVSQNWCTGLLLAHRHVLVRGRDHVCGIIGLGLAATKAALDFSNGQRRRPRLCPQVLSPAPHTQPGVTTDRALHKHNHKWRVI